MDNEHFSDQLLGNAIQDMDKHNGNVQVLTLISFKLEIYHSDS